MWLEFRTCALPIFLGYSVRDPEKYTHWYDFVGAYMEIDESVWSTVIAIRVKKKKQLHK
jgi:hypothetical protein